MFMALPFKLELAGEPHGWGCDPFDLMTKIQLSLTSKHQINYALMYENYAYNRR
jgi:hypothetical protein